MPDAAKRLHFVGLRGVLLLAGLMMAGGGSLAAQRNGPSMGAAAAGGGGLGGRVVNALTGVGVGRVLVQLGGEAVLTDREGRFSFAQPAGAAVGIRATKPGFSTSPEQVDDSTPTALGDQDPANLQIPVWPEAILAGTVTANDGEPLGRITVLARRNVFDEQGHHQQMAGQAQTDSHGGFRLPVAAGEYTIETSYSPPGFERQQAVLPSIFPKDSRGGGGGSLHVSSGQELRLALTPQMGVPHTVTVRLEGSEGPPPRITARTADGVGFQVGSRGEGAPGVVRVELPPGSYVLQASIYAREAMLLAEASVTVPDHDIPGPVLHMATSPSTPIEIVADAAGASRVATSQPTAMQFNLSLQPTQSDFTSPTQFGVRPTMQRDGSASFAAPPGVYRLSGGISGGWYIRSATYGGLDLLRQDLVLAQGGGTTPIRLVVSNQTGSLNGVTRLAGKPAACTFYLLNDGSSLPRALVRKSNSDGTFALTGVPPGSYRAVAFPYHYSAALDDPAVLGRFSSYVASVTVRAGDTAEVEMDAVPASEAHP